MATLAEPRLLVTDGIFGWSRNPMYLAGVVILLGLGVFLEAALPLVVVPLFGWVAYRWYVAPEEALLSARFREEYAEYCRKVRRWL